MVFVHLCSRPQAGYSILGRETALQKLRWDTNDWPYLAHGGIEPADKVPAPSLPVHPFPAQANEYEFTETSLPPEFHSLRIPVDDSWLSCGDNALTLRGLESLASPFRTALIARRIQHHASRAETTVDCAPRDFQHLAGLVAIYDNAHWLYLHLTRDGDDQTGQRILRMGIMDNGVYREAGHFLTKLPENGAIDLAVEIKQLQAFFSYRLSGQTEWISMPNALPAELLADEYGPYKFTGAMVGMACQDLSGQGHPATFTRFAYSSLE